MGLTAEEVRQFKELGYVVKDSVYSSDDLQLLKDGLTGAVQEKCDELIAAGELDRDFAEEPFETRLTRLHRYNPEAAHKVLMSIWSGRFHGPGDFEGVAASTVDCVY